MFVNARANCIFLALGLKHRPYLQAVIFLSSEGVVYRQASDLAHVSVLAPCADLVHASDLALAMLAACI